MRIVAADDDAGMRKVLDRCLRAWGYEPVLCENGRDAWAVLKREDCPRVVVLDWDMPGLSGLEVCRLLRSTPHGGDLYVLMLTARQEKSDIVAALESGADDFLAKPFHSRELQLRLAKGVRDASRAMALNVERASNGGRASNVERIVPPTGTTLAGKYRLEKKIASGGMGSVWLGVHLSLGVNIAIKFMDRALAETAAYASFEREARAAAQLRNEHIVRIYDHGVDQHGLPYLVMEYLGGDSLSERVDAKGPLSPADVVSLVEQVASALTEAHARGVVHRDIKPDNILLVEDADRERSFTAKVIDFGLADPESSRRDNPGEIAGTPQYMSPEYLSATAKPDRFLDLWALAVTAFVAMTGTTPFDGDGVDAIYRRVLSTPPVPSHIHPSVPPGFDAWFERACASLPSARFQSAAEMASALAAACPGESGVVPPLAAAAQPLAQPLAPESPSPSPSPQSAALFAATETDMSPPGSSSSSKR